MFLIGNRRVVAFSKILATLWKSDRRIHIIILHSKGVNSVTHRGVQSLYVMNLR